MSVSIEILFLVLAVAPIAAAGPPLDATPLITDGRFDDWPEVPAVLEDPIDAAPGAAVDLGALRLFDEPAYLHLDLELRRPVNAQGLRGSIRILLDGDGDPETGAPVGGLPGTDAVVILSRLDRPRGGGFGAGTGIQPVLDGSPGETLPPARAGLLAAPTWAAPRLEIRIDRGLALGGPALLTGDSLRLKVVYETEGSEDPVDQTEIGSYRFRTSYRPPPAPAPFDLSKPQGAFRVVAWNVAGRGIGDAPGPFARVLSAIQPDVVLLDEAHGSLTREELAAFFARVSPAEGSSRWSFVAGQSGGRQRGIVASRLPLRPEPSLLGALPYPEGDLDRLAAEVGEGGFRALVDIEREAGLASAGAWVGTGEGEVLFVPVDLQSRGFLDSAEDRLRVLQARAIRQRVETALTAAKTPDAAVVIAGDLNLVGGGEPLEVLAAGLDPRGGDLTVAECPALDGRSQVTWRATNNPDSLYGPGRLDFHLHSSSGLEAVKGFVFDAGALPEEQRRRLGLEPDDSRVTSDHLPVVADYRWRRPASAAGSDTVSP